MTALRVNGVAHEVQAAPDTPLLYVLRNELGLYAAKLGCGLEQCGSCSVIIDGEARASCRIPKASARRRRRTRSSARSSPRTQRNAATAARAS